MVRPWCKTCNNTQKCCGIYLLMRWLGTSRFTSTRTFDFHVSLEKDQILRKLSTTSKSIEREERPRMRYINCASKIAREISNCATGRRRYNHSTCMPCTKQSRKFADLLEGPYELQATIPKHLLHVPYKTRWCGGEIQTGV